MTSRHALALALAILSIAGPAAAQDPADRPVAVSPGHADRLTLVGDRCPTFSWAQLPGTDRYELVVYRVDRSDETTPVALRTTLPGQAGSWTPPLGRCLARGGRYAWSLRARRGRTLSGWSEPALFQITELPGPAELEEALTAVQEHLGAPRPAAGAPTEPSIRAADATECPPNDPAARRRETGGPLVPGAAADTALSVDGRIEAAAFSGDGAALANVQAAGLACTGCLSGGELADGAITAAKIGAPCATGEVLMRDATGWQCAALAAPACAPGDQIGCYTGPAGTLGVGECAAGSRLCAADSTWGECTGQAVPAPAELCNGLDDTCDGSTDEGDPTALCPLTANVTATLCDAATCAVTACAELWADADGDYANGCEAPTPGACLEGGAPRPAIAPGTGQLVIREFLADPASPLSDADAEWFEVVATADVDLNGLGIGTTFGTTIDQIDDPACLPLQAGETALFARSDDPAVNGGLTAHRLFGFSLVNGGGELHLAHGGNLVDAVSWVSGDVVAGRARSLDPALQSAADNDDPSSWCTVPADPALLYADGNYGTPGLANVACP